MNLKGNILRDGCMVKGGSCANIYNIIFDVHVILLKNSKLRTQRRRLGHGSQES